ncbi:MAG: hypothetical protein NUW01_15715 [Gemmatimonadaceae bacterium]|nr:hypothetical protein [Gemmatimonadaceae bacterium]
MGITRRGAFVALAAVAAGAWARSSKAASIFAEKVHLFQTRMTPNGVVFKERGVAAQFEYAVLEDAERFHQMAERIRVSMIGALRKEGAPINAWRIGALTGRSEDPINAWTGEIRPWRDAHVLRLRTRAAVDPRLVS